MGKGPVLVQWGRHGVAWGRFAAEISRLRKTGKNLRLVSECEEAEKINCVAILMNRSSRLRESETAESISVSSIANTESKKRGES